MYQKYMLRLLVYKHLFHQYFLCDIAFRVNIFAHSVFLNTHLYGVRDVVNIC